jgi:hypothetical protein
MNIDQEHQNSKPQAIRMTSPNSSWYQCIAANPSHQNPAESTPRDQVQVHSLAMGGYY